MTDTPGIDALPQIISIAPISGNNKINIRKEVRKYLGTDQGIWLAANGEVTLRAGSSGDGVPVKGKRLELPLSVLQSLAASEGSLIALVERKGALALKKIEMREQKAEQARVIDDETPYRITRTVEMNAMPDELLPVLADRYREHELQYDIMTFLSGGGSLESWLTRRLLGVAGREDGALRRELIEQRMQTQRPDGSWAGDVVQTARHLRELGQLGVTKSNGAVEAGAQWLFGRAESAANPGMFFMDDRIVHKQASINEKRRSIREGRASGPLGKLRLPNATKSQHRRLEAGDDLLAWSCGFIMWPNAFVLEALLPLGYEKHPRVQRSIESLMHGYTYWCECNYRLRAGNHVRHSIPSDDELAAREEDCINQYRYGGVPDPEQYLQVPRARGTNDGKDTFLLHMPTHIQACEVITTRALHQVGSSHAHEAAAAHLWRFAGVQQHDGRFLGGAEYNSSQAQMLQVFSRYDHPASLVAIMRLVPWIIDNQQPDGSWGEGTKKDASTLAVIQALLRVKHLLPAVIKP